jgi:dipeptidyl-peptidase-4
LTCLLATAQDKRPILTLEDIFTTGKTYPRGVYGIRHMDKYYTTLDGGKIYKGDYQTGEQSLLFDPATAREAGMAHKMDDYALSPDGKKLLLMGNTQSLYRYSKKSSCYVWDFATGSLTAVFDGLQVYHPSLSPNGSHLAFVYENNLYVQELQGTEVRQITFDGAMNQIINGMSDWVYEEEFALVRAYEWCPTGQYLAYLRFDERQVKEYEIPTYTGATYPGKYSYKYPKTGEDNSVLSLWMYDMEAKATREMDLGNLYDTYVPRIKWMNAHTLSAIKLNRLQNHMQLLAVPATGGVARVMYEEKSDTYLDINDDLTFIEGGRQFILSSDRSGYNHLYHYSAEGKLIRALTEGRYDVTAFYGYDPLRKLLYYQAAEPGPLERRVYSIGLNAKGKKALAEGYGTHEASFSGDFSYCIHTYSSINTPPVVSLREGNGQVVRVLEDNAAFAGQWEELSAGLGFEFVSMPGADGTQLNGWQMKPADFDPNKEYPLLMFVYGGPGSQMVLDQWYVSNRAWFTYLAQRGYYIACFDNRGTGARGASFKKCTYKHLGQMEVEDQIAVGYQMAELPYIDDKRIGIFGWSYGGFMSAHCLARGEGVFQVAVSVAPVTDWAYYDNIYTERYMQRPIDNPDGYDNTRVMKFSDGLRDRDLLLVHGSFDDNVHPQNAYELMQDLVTKNIAFDSEIYINKNHGIYGGYTRLHLFGKISRYLDEHLRGY